MAGLSPIGFGTGQGLPGTTPGGLNPWVATPTPNYYGGGAGSPQTGNPLQNASNSGMSQLQTLIQQAGLDPSKLMAQSNSIIGGINNVPGVPTVANAPTVTNTPDVGQVANPFASLNANTISSAGPASLSAFLTNPQAVRNLVTGPANALMTQGPLPMLNQLASSLGLNPQQSLGGIRNIFDVQALQQFIKEYLPAVQQDQQTMLSSLQGQAQGNMGLASEAQRALNNNNFAQWQQQNQNLMARWGLQNQNNLSQWQQQNQLQGAQYAQMLQNPTIAAQLGLKAQSDAFSPLSTGFNQALAALFTPGGYVRTGGGGVSGSNVQGANGSPSDPTSLLGGLFSPDQISAMFGGGASRPVGTGTVTGLGGTPGGAGNAGGPGGAVPAGVPAGSWQGSDAGVGSYDGGSSSWGGQEGGISGVPYGETSSYPGSGMPTNPSNGYPNTPITYAGGWGPPAGTAPAGQVYVPGYGYVPNTPRVG